MEGISERDGGHSPAAGSPRRCPVAVGERVGLAEYAEREWRGETQKASRMKKVGSCVSPKRVAYALSV